MSMAAGGNPPAFWIIIVVGVRVLCCITAQGLGFVEH
jgi:hypothetical protein